MKSTLFNMVAVLFSITLIASAGVGAVNMITADAIAEAKAVATKQAIANVLPEFDSSEQSEQTIDDMPIKVYTAKDGTGARPPNLGRHRFPREDEAAHRHRARHGGSANSLLGS